MKLPRRQRVAGFTLIEVLAALVIVAVGMLAVIEAVSTTISNASYMREKTIAHWVAMNKLADVRLSNTAPTAGNSDGDVDMAGTTWHWRMTIVATDITSMLRIDILVAPKEQTDANENASIASITGFYSTAISTSGNRIEWDVNPNAGRRNARAGNGNSSSGSRLRGDTTDNTNASSSSTSEGG